MLATRIAPRFGLDRAVQFGLLLTAAGSVATLLVPILNPTFVPFLCAMSVFVLGMAIVNPLGTPQAPSPFPEKAGPPPPSTAFRQIIGPPTPLPLAPTISH